MNNCYVNAHIELAITTYKLEEREQSRLMFNDILVTKKLNAIQISKCY